MKLLIGTLYTIENEFEACLRSVREQTYPVANHHVIRDLPNKEAHAALFRYFLDRTAEYDLLVKVDADMVLTRPTFLAEVVAEFAREPHLEQLQVWVHDWFTDRLIGGMNVYRNTISWVDGGDAVYVEGTSIAHQRPGGRRTDRSVLAPAAYHCPDPSPFQAFHFGIHKGVKVRQGLSQGMPARAAEHLANVEHTWAHFRRSGDVRLGMAALGGELALVGMFGPDDLPYANPRALEVFNREHAALAAPTVAARVSALRRRNGGLLPPSLRLEYLGGGWKAVGRSALRKGRGWIEAARQRLRFNRGETGRDS